MWAIAIGLLVLIAAVSWTAVPIVQVHLVVRDTRLPEKDASFVARLGGEGAARERLKRCLYLADWLAPDRFRTATLLRCCPGGEKALIGILRDPGAPVDLREMVPAVLIAELTGDMDEPRGWLAAEFERSFEDPCPEVRLAAAGAVWRLCELHQVPDRQLASALDVIIETMKQEDVTLRHMAVRDLSTAMAFSDSSDPASGKLRRRAEAALKAALKDDDPGVRRTAALMLEASGSGTAGSSDRKAQPPGSVPRK